MGAEARDIHRTAVYGVNAVARAFLPIGAVGLAAGAVLLWLGDRDGLLPGVLSLAIGLAAVGYMAIRAVFPAKPLLELSPAGLLMRISGVKEFTIPWREVQDFGILDVTVEDVPTSRGGVSLTFDNVAAVTISRGFYDRAIHVDSGFLRGPGWSSTFIPHGDRMQVALHHELLKVPAAELREAVELRWQAFGPGAVLPGTAPSGRTEAAPGKGVGGLRRILTSRSVAVRHGAGPAMTVLAIVGAALWLLSAFDIWPFSQPSSEQAADRRWERSEREWAERERQIAEINAGFERMRRETDEAHRREAAAETEQARQRALVTAAREERERAELQAGGPLPSPPPARIAGHRASVTTLAVAANGRTFVSGAADGSLKLWDTRASTALRDLGTQKAPIRALAIAPDGLSVASAGMDGEIVRRALPDGEPLGGFDASGDGAVLALALSADGRRLLSAHASGEVALWDLEARKRLASLNPGGPAQAALAVSADGATALGAGADGVIRVWDLEAKSLARTLQGHQGAVLSLTLDRKAGLAVSGGEDGTMRLWSLRQGAELRRFAHRSPVVSVAIDPDGRRIVSASTDETARLWEAESGKELRSYRSFGGPFPSLAFAANGRFVAGTPNGTIRLLDADGGEPMRYFADR